MQYERSEYDFYPGLYRVRGDTVDVFMADGEVALRVEYFGDEIESLRNFDIATQRSLETGTQKTSSGYR